MALATTCPQCKTSFRVVPDQLKLRRGLVRCGVCRHVFSGIDSLRYVAEGAHPVSAPPPAASGAQGIVPASIQRGTVEQASVEPVEPIEPIEATKPERTEPERTEPERTEPERTEPEATEPEPTEPEPIEPEPTEPEPTEPEPTEPEQTEPLRQGPVAARAADTGGPASEEADAVDFFAPDTRARGFASRGAAFASVAAVALASLLLLQLAIGGRDWLASRVPALGPVLGAALGPLGLRIEPPRESGALTIESFELQPGGAPSLYALTALVRNRTSHMVQWPALELSLLDGNGDIIARKVLRPADYLASAPEALRRGVAGRAEMPLRAAIEVLDATPTGYRVRIVDP